MSFRALVLTAAAFIAAGIAAAGPDRRETTPRPQAALFLFSGEGFAGEVRQVFEPVPAMTREFNDRARSVAVIEGQWELCEHSDFTGRCVFVRDDVEDLSWFGLSGRVTSARPILEYTEARHGLLFNRDGEGRIRYVDAEEYGERRYRYGYANDTRLRSYHYGYSPDYRRYGYYDPLFGYDPYGFGYGRSDYYRHGRYYDPFNDPWRSERRYYGARNGAVTLYQHSNGNGVSLGLNGSLEDLRRYRLNDTISSLYVREGQWEVCSDAYFGGECRIVDASNGVVNLSGFNDRVSSVRRIDGGGTTPTPDRPSRRGRQEDISGVLSGALGSSSDRPPGIPDAVPVIASDPVYRDAPPNDPVIQPEDIARPMRRGGGAHRVPDFDTGRAADPIPDTPSYRDLPAQPVYDAPQPAYDPPPPPPRFDPPPSYDPPPRFDPPPRYDPPEPVSPSEPVFDRQLD